MSRIEGPVGVVGGEGLLVGPLGAVPPQLADEAPLGGPEGLAEDLVPRSHIRANRAAVSHSTTGRLDSIGSLVNR